MATEAEIKAVMRQVLEENGGEMLSQRFRTEVLRRLVPPAKQGSDEDGQIGVLREFPPFEVGANAEGRRVVRLIEPAVAIRDTGGEIVARASGSEIAATIQKLKELHDNGALTDDEFREAKARLIAHL